MDEELKLAVIVANKTLDEPWRDSDDDLSMMSRQFLRSQETIDRLRAQLAARHGCNVPFNSSSTSIR